MLIIFFRRGRKYDVVHLLHRDCQQSPFSFSHLAIFSDTFVSILAFPRHGQDGDIEILETRLYNSIGFRVMRADLRGPESAQQVLLWTNTRESAAARERASDSSRISLSLSCAGAVIDGGPRPSRGGIVSAAYARRSVAKEDAWRTRASLAPAASRSVTCLLLPAAVYTREHATLPVRG